MLEEETDVPVAIEEFAGGWIRLPPTEQTRLAAAATTASAPASTPSRASAR
jgi:predicted component of type VI protein secretion system